MIVTIPFLLVNHLFLAFFTTTPEVSGHGCSLDEPDQFEDFETDYFQELPNRYASVVLAEEPLDRVVEVPHSGPSGDYYYSEGPEVRHRPLQRKPVQVVRRVDCPAYFEEVVMPPSPPPFLAPMHVFDDTDMC